MSRTPKVGTSVIFINENEEILIGKRKGSHGEDLWSVPGGHVDHNEKILDSCYREVEEEIGVKREDLQQYGITFLEFSEDFFPEEDKHYITMYYFIDVPNDMPVKNCEPNKCSGWEWFHYTELPDNMFCNNNEVIERLMGATDAY